MSNRAIIGLVIGLVVLVVGSFALAFISLIGKAKSLLPTTFAAPTGHVVYKFKMAGIRQYEARYDVLTAVTGEPQRTFEMQTMLTFMPLQVHNGAANLSYERVQSYRDRDQFQTPQTDLHQMTMSPYGVTKEWTIHGGATGASAGQTEKMDPKLLFFDLEIPALIFPERVLKPNDHWTSNGTTKLYYRHTVLNGSYDLRFRLLDAGKGKDNACRRIESHFTFDCPKQSTDAGAMSLRETGSATFTFNVAAGELTAIDGVTITRNIAGERNGKPRNICTTMKGSVKDNSKENPLSPASASPG